MKEETKKEIRNNIYEVIRGLSNLLSYDFEKGDCKIFESNHQMVGCFVRNAKMYLDKILEVNEKKD